MRPSDAETRQPFVTFQSCLSSSLELGSAVLGISRTPRGKEDWVAGADSGSLIEGTLPLIGEFEYSCLLMADCGIVVGDAALGVG